MRIITLFFYTVVVAVMLIAGCAKSDTAGDSGKSVIPVGKGPDAMFLTPDETYLYIANVEDSLISVIDTRKDQVIQSITVVKYPWGFTRLGDSNIVAVSSWDKGITLIDFTRHKIIRQQQYEDNLGGIASTRDGKTIFVVATEQNKVFKIDVATLGITGEYPTGNGPDGIGISGDDSKIYVTNTKDGTISVITLADKSTKVISTGGKPELIHFNHDHSRLFISNFKRNKIYILDTNADEIIHELTGLNGPEEAVLSKAEDHLYVVNLNTSKVFVYDAQNFQKLPQEFTTGSKPIGIVPVKGKKKLYVTNYGDNTVSVIKYK